MSERLGYEVHLKRRPVGIPRESDFELVQVPVPAPGEGEALVRNIYMSVDPYMRGKMRARKSYTPPFQVGKPLSGGCVGQVVVSRNPGFEVGDYVSSWQGWRELYLSDGSNLRKIDPTLAPIHAYLGAVGMPGMTAYIGLLEIGQLKAGETVYVSAASGAVGSIACQISKILGCRVVGSAGTDEKVAWLMDEAGIDAAFNYKRTDDLMVELGRQCPTGIDVYFDNVGGPHLQAALQHMNDHGRIVACGMISEYNAIKNPPGPNNLRLLFERRLTLKGFIVTDHYDRLPQFRAAMRQWISEGRIKWRETIVEGIENAPRAFLGLFEGQNRGKMIVQVGPDPAV